MEKQILSVGQINDYIKNRLDNDPGLRNIAIRGELSNYKVYPSGHHYFTIKDGTGAMKCVMFKSAAMRLRFRPENGMQVIAMGSITVYVRDGVYQLYCTGMVMDGIGDLYAAFEQLKTKLAAQGLFDPAHKKPLPRLPGTIGIITSSAGAAVHDMLRILRKRYPLTQVRLLPVRVQGVEAPAEIAGAIAYANHHKLADLLIVGRGGGSIEDLWAFNDEMVARAIYDSKIPVISAVGHEPDVTISDFVADLRAATPSNAAELAVPDQDALLQTLDEMQNAMAVAMQTKIDRAGERLANLSGRPVLKSPLASFESRRKALELMEKRLIAAQSGNVARKRQRFVAQVSKLDAMSPLKVLTRGYAMVAKEDGTIVRSVHDVKPREPIAVRVSDGTIVATVIGGKSNE
ncbi:MAG: exodeoxyribonuclease VII large subunit [Oscillospiraceae bacterium]|nr:exodeoxyribonuclease VII large subunit [Oscillospiraceae bacterium]